MSKFLLVPSTRFKKDLKKYLNKNREMEAISDCLTLLADGGSQSIPSNMKPHKLIGNYSKCWECHIMSDLLVIWEEEDEPINEIYLVRIGTHSELF